MTTLHFVWFFLTPLLQILIGSEIFLVSSQCLDDEKSLLLQLKGSLQFNSSMSTKLARWNSNNASDCCFWDGVACDSSGHVISLELDNEAISGGIENSSALFSFHYLKKLNLAYNTFNVGVPAGIYNLTNLKYLNLSGADFVGQIPGKIFQIQVLEILDLSNNDLLGGSIPKFPPNGSLRMILLSHTNLSGSLPDSISNHQNLSTLKLSNCSFSGSIPSTMAKLTNLVYLDFSMNNFTGFIPYFHRSKKLTYLDLSNNGLSGHLSPYHFEGLSELSYINLRNNSLSGILPAYIFELPSLQQLFLNNNQFVGQVKEFHNASSSLLDGIDLSNNRLNGSIPKSIFDVGRVKVLSLSSNFFGGTLPINLIGKLSNLRELDLSYNNLTIDTTRSNSTLPQLETLKLVSCRLQKFPDLRNQSRMAYLDLSNNQIQGPIPNWIWEIGGRGYKTPFNTFLGGSLGHLNLSYNQLEYLEQPYLIPMSLIRLDLHSNRLKGDIPIPTPPSFLMFLDYSSNKFSNPIPLGFDNFVAVATFISLANNSLTGRIPESICNASHLQVLDLSNNDFSGTIPPCLLEYSTTLGVVNLGSNNLHGVIPDSLPIGCALQTLDLSGNTLQGRLPKSLINCESLEVLNVGNNRLVDSFPSMLKNTSSLRVLVLRSNGFYGDFLCDPTSYSWKNLQIIDIASNKFTGELSTECLSNWNGMMVGDDYTKSGHNGIQFNAFQITSFYTSTVTIIIKGMEMELVKILRIYTSIDFSSNRFRGVIPDVLGNLSSLYLLNLSHNAFEGPIPKSIGKLRNLESLDLSRNRLSGEIPVELADNTFLSVLNLSFNNLFGRIPSTRQFLTFSETSFEGNKGLCGFPLKDCKRNDSPPKLPPTTSEEDSEFDWTYVFAAAGYIAGAANTVVLLWFYEPVKIWFDIKVQKCLIWFSTM